MIFSHHVVLIRYLLMSKNTFFYKNSCLIHLIFRNKSENVESLIHIFSLLTSEKRFLAAYEDYFDLNQIIDIVHQTTGLL